MSQAKLGMRTRRPIGSDDGSAVSGYAGAEVLDVTIVNALGDLNDDLNDTAAGENGYATGSSRYMHVHLDHDGVNDVTVCAFNYAFGSWAPLLKDNFGAGDAYTPVVLDTDGHVVLDISGIDRVGFVSAGDPDALKIAFNSF